MGQGESDPAEGETAPDPEDIWNLTPRSRGLPRVSMSEWVLQERYSYNRKTVVRQMGQLRHTVTLTEHTSPRPPGTPGMNETQTGPLGSTQAVGRSGASGIRQPRFESLLISFVIAGGRNALQPPPGCYEAPVQAPEDRESTRCLGPPSLGPWPQASGFLWGVILPLPSRLQLLMRLSAMGSLIGLVWER